jgi:hypothetical protein
MESKTLIERNKAEAKGRKSEIDMMMVKVSQFPFQKVEEDKRDTKRND